MIKYIILGIVQGITEFLPVSSSGHLVILQKVFGMSGEELALPIVLHLGTLLALLVFFFKDIIETFRSVKLLLFIFTVTLITGIIGILGKAFFERLFSDPKLVAIALMITGIILIFTRKLKDTKRDILDITDAITLGFAQALAIIPGISRSGITISTLLFRKIDSQTCFKFSFLASIPAILGAALLEARKIDFALQTNLINFMVGFLSSFFVGIFSLRLLKIILKQARLYCFGFYCIVIGLITLLFIR